MAASTSGPLPAGPAVSGWVFAAAGCGPEGYFHPTMAPVIPRDLRNNYPRRGFNDVKLGPVWKTRRVEEYMAMEQLAALRRGWAREEAPQIFCRFCGCSSWFEAMTDQCCLSAKGRKCDFTGESCGTGSLTPRIGLITGLITSSPEPETKRSKGTPKAKGVAKHGKPGTDTDHAPSTSFLVEDDQETRGAIDDPEAVAAFARSFQLS
jgi:hypothetical protein